MVNRSTALALCALILAVALTACGGGDGLPGQPGEYVVKSKSVTFDGERYRFQWAPTGKSDLSWATSRDVRLRLDDRTYLEVDGSKQAILHLTQDEPVAVVRKEQGREYASAWYPYDRTGATVVVEREYRQPIYVYPPTSSFGSGETLTGGVRADRPADPVQIQKLQAASNTASGQASGTGGGNAVLNKTGSTVAEATSAQPTRPVATATAGSAAQPTRLAATATPGSAGAAPTRVAPTASAESGSTTRAAPTAAAPAKPAAPTSGAPARVPAISTKK